jgi:recombination protein RecA
MSATLARLRERLDAHTRLPASPAESPRRWCLPALQGRLTELSGTGGVTLTPALCLIREAQNEYEPVAWVTGASQGIWCPFDIAESGIDLDSLILVQVPGHDKAGRAADTLARSGAFGVVVLDLGWDADVPAAIQGRLAQAAQQYHMIVLALTGKSSRAASIGSLVTLRVHAERKRTGDDRWEWTLRALKDKRRGPGWEEREVVHGPPGLR